MDELIKILQNTDIQILSLILLIGLGLSFLIQCIYYLFFYIRIYSKTTSGETKKLPVSVIICARNEAENLQKFLPSVLEQDYPNFEVVVVNDCSADETAYVLTKFKEKYTNLYVTSLNEDELFEHGKKLALSLGIKAARNEILLMTDADCEPVSPNWISEMLKNFSKKTSIVLGYGGFFKLKGFLNKLIRYDCMFIALQYSTFAKVGFPYMGVGRNLAYRKKLFFEQNGFASHTHLASGDDDLFINKAANKLNTKVELNPESFTRSEPKTSFSDWIQQKKRHLTTGVHYKTKDKFLLATEIMSRTLFFMLLLILLFMQKFVIISLTFLVIRIIIQNIVIVKASKVFNEKDLLFFGTFFDILILLLNFKVYFSNLTDRRKIQWK